MDDLRVQPETTTGNGLLEGYKETEIGLLPEEWNTAGFEETIVKKRIKVGKVKQAEYRDVGRFPIIDQGQDLTAGHWDDPSEVYAGELPIIVFGDHTRIFKYVNFPFVAGADGVKVLLPNTERYDPHFLYFSYLTLDVPSRGYNRHFSLLREKRLPLPPLTEQKNIAHVLRTVQKAIETTEQVIESTRELKRSLMNHLFTYGPVPVDEAEQVPLKETEIGSVPEHWDLVELGSVADVRSGGTPSKKRPDFWQGTIPWASPKDLKQLRLSDSQDHISTEALESGSRLAPIGTVLVVVRGMILAKDIPVAITEVPMAFNQDLKALSPHDSISPEYLLHSMVAYKKALAREIGTSAHGTRRIGASALKQWLLPLPSRDEQQIIVESLAALDRKAEVEANRKQTLALLFKTLLHNLLTGKVRVNDLDLYEVEEMV